MDHTNLHGCFDCVFFLTVFFSPRRNGKELIKTPNIKPSYEDDTAVLTINKMSMDLDGEYKCIAENSAGTSETVAKVVVEGKTILNVIH